MACEGEVPFNSLQVLSQARRVSNSPLSLQNETTNHELKSCKFKSCSLHSFKKESSSLSLLSNRDELDSESHLDYKSGAIYDGGLIDNHKFGNGTFLWPNGDKYIGEFKLNYRHGFGIQVWNDGSTYEGYFYEDRRSGQGTHKWKNGDTYTGNWLLDYRHGFGKYSWKDGNVFEGMFFMNNREGFGTLMYSSGDLYLGLYKKDSRYGPGILKYPNNTQDVGFWNGDTLVRILTPVDINFTANDLEPVDKKIDLKSWFSRENLLYDTLNPQNLFSNKIFSTQSNKFIRNDPYIDKVIQQRTLFYEQYLKEFEKYLQLKNFNQLEYRKDKQVIIPNITDNLKNIFIFQKRFDFYDKTCVNVLDFSVKDFESMNREKFGSPGLIETYSIELLNACIQKNWEGVKVLKNLVNFDVCDNRGYSPIIIAILKCDSVLINYLLDNGANINHLLDNGLSGLMICMIRYYTSDKFLPNSALKHQDLTLTRKITPYSLVVPSQDEVVQNEKENTIQNFEDAYTVVGESTKPSEFGSTHSLLRFKVQLNEDLVCKYTDIMSKNENLDQFNENDSNKKLLKKSTQLQFLNDIGQIIDLLLRRGADPSLSSIPYPALCFAVAAGDIKVVKLLLEKGADCNKKMPKKYASLTPLCLACGVLGETGPELVKLLLDSLADPNASSDMGNEYLSMSEEGWKNEIVSDEIANLIVGRTPLHIACSRNDPYASKVIRLLLEHSANPNMICNGQSPLSLAIASGNKEAIDLLLKSNLCDPNLPLTNGVGSALCVISSTLYEHNWLPHERIKLIDKLIHYGADILQPIAFGARRYVGTVVDYAHYMYNSDNRLAHTPYHSLTINERNAHNARKNLLSHLAYRYREKALERARVTISGMDYTNSNRRSWGTAIRTKKSDDMMTESDFKSDKKLMKWCYYCGRSVGVKLMPCSRCKKVYYCSNNCKQRGWNELHKNECELPESAQRNKSALKNRKSATNKKDLSLGHNDRNAFGGQRISMNPDFNGLDNYSFN
ncbi:unnamed protein product [Brachionus calyciflorus]|uniref:MYND-type domain-containing protein n=1 Tax=Brachionus calyciflorus TaxID=104777 RepID=A0A813M455_9BILA|nr:unnamed protein product [Brachionus calyciflorus]